MHNRDVESSAFEIVALCIFIVFIATAATVFIIRSGVIPCN